MRCHLLLLPLEIQRLILLFIHIKSNEKAGEEKTTYAFSCGKEKSLCQMLQETIRTMHFGECPYGFF